MYNRRKKKGSMELSVNSIVILVIAIVVMGLILGFIREQFKKAGSNPILPESLRRVGQQYRGKSETEAHPKLT